MEPKTRTKDGLRKKHLKKGDLIVPIDGVAEFYYKVKDCLLEVEYQLQYANKDFLQGRDTYVHILKCLNEGHFYGRSLLVDSAHFTLATDEDKGKFILEEFRRSMNGKRYEE